MKVLVVDDSGTMRSIIRRNLEKLGVSDITEAADGATALSVFGSGGFDVVLSDWNMPNMSGLEFLTAVRQLNADVPFIMITTEAERARVIAAIQAGVSDYMVKPFTAEALFEKLHKWVGASA